MAALADIVQRVKENLYGAFPTEAPFVTTLAASHDDSETGITVLDDEQWEINDIGENASTNEQWIVLAKAGSDVLTVKRGWNGTTAAASSGSDDVILKNPRFTYQKISNEITNTLLALERWGVHVFGVGTITRADPKTFYEVTETDIIPHMGVLKVYSVLDNSDAPNPIPFRWQYHLGTGPSEYSSTGNGVYIGDWGDVANTEDAHFIYAQRIDATTDLLSRQEETVVQGATAGLLGATIIPATHDPGSRSDRTTQPGQTSRDWRHFQGRFIADVRQEAGLLSVERQKFLQETPRHTRARRWVN